MLRYQGLVVQAPWAAWLITAAATAGRETYTAWLPGVSLTVALARSDMARWAAGGISGVSRAEGGRILEHVLVLN